MKIDHRAHRSLTRSPHATGHESRLGVAKKVLSELRRMLGRDGFGAPRSTPVDLSGVGSSVSAAGQAPTFTGFDAGKLAAPLARDEAGRVKSAKYAFAKLAQESGTMPRTKAEAEQWFTRFIKPGLEKDGFGVDWVKGDKALIRTRENPQGEVVDFLRGADSNDASYQALAWQPE